ncbi:MAG TPA: HEAT repeat domain-containing protein [Bryobacteraceae bacterium]|nr:HEAT repeat domain-containing protein [Bryobacteraceae bacterium]
MSPESELLESYTQDLTSLAESITEKDPAGKQSMLQLLTGDAQAFCAAGICVLARAKPSPGARLLVHLLGKEKLLTAGLLDPELSREDDAAAAARSIEEMGTRLQLGFEIALSAALQIRSKAENSARVLRILRLLEAIEAQSCWPSFQNELLTHPDQIVRSKSTLLIGRTSKNMAWISRRLLDRDPRVQANAVEALWEMNPAEALPALRTALHSPHSRVAANAALGLYRMSELKAIPALLEMAKHPDPRFRISALWSIAETGDPRFIPYLMEQFKTEQGKAKLFLMRALSQIRRREKSNAGQGVLSMHVSEATVSAERRRRIVVTLSRPGVSSLPALKPAHFALWEGGQLINDYEVRCPAIPALLLLGFIVPRSFAADPYEQAIQDALKRCKADKRADDLWRIDRYIAEDGEKETRVLTEASPLPYDDELVTNEIKNHHGFIADPGQLEKAILHTVPKDRAASDVIKAIERQYESLTKTSGKRHLFVFVHPDSVDLVEESDNIKRLKTLAEKESIALHGIFLGPAPSCSGFRDLCLSGSEGTFSSASAEDLASEFEHTFHHLLKHFEIEYTLAGDPASVVLQVNSTYGIGRTEFTLTSAS